MQQPHYVGLNNLGNTCYMNSLLQTLFMTRQFRESLFQLWRYSPLKDPEPGDCIPLQLQLLLARLQKLKVDSIDAKRLITSFQWFYSQNTLYRDAQESFQQHDVQEFCRVLFEAIQQSCQNEQFIQRLYESQSESYVKCLKCSQESVRCDRFMDLSLTVKSEFDKVYNQSVEKALKYYLKPDHLCGNNLYFCENCDEKVEALKGLRFTQLSDILTIQLNRFELDYNTFERKKVNNYVSYPFVLNMNEFMKPYDKILVLEDTVFLQEEAIEIERKFDDPLKRRTNRQPSPDEKPTNLNPIDKMEQKAELKRFSYELGQKFQSLEKKKVTFTTTMGNHNLVLTADETYDIDNYDSETLFGDSIEMKEINEPSQHVSNQMPLNESSNDKSSFCQKDLDKILAEVEEESHHQSIQEQVGRYLKDGPNVYELYSIMIHSGGALGGHYYAYIKSFENNRWYSFNDSQVKRISWAQVMTMFGDKVPKCFYIIIYSQVNCGVSAYFLMYRRVIQNDTNEPAIPQDLDQLLQDEIDAQIIKYQMEEDLKRVAALQLRIRVFYGSTDSIIICKKTDKLSDFKQEAMRVLEVKENEENTRIRIYNIHEQTMLETFTGKEELVFYIIVFKSLNELNFKYYNTLFIETKDENQIFYEYDPHLIRYKINTWREGINMVDEFHLKPRIIQLRDSCKVQDLVSQIASQFNLNPDKLIILKRTSMGQKYHSELINIKLENGMFKDIGPLTLKLSNNLNLYVEEADTGWKVGEPTKWDREFETDKFRCTIVFNDPRMTLPDCVPDYNLQISIDSRMSMYDAKEKVSQILQLDADQFIVKRGNRFNPELKDLSTAIRDNGIIGRGTMHLTLGKPAIQGQYLIKVCMGGLSKECTDSLEYEVTEMFEMQISNDQTVANLKDLLCKEIMSRKSIELNPKLIRLRERINMKLGRVYHNTESLRSTRLYDRQGLVIEEILIEEQTKPGQLLVYVKLFDMQAMQLSYPPQELFIYPQDKLLDFAGQVSDCLNIAVSNVEACKIHNIYSFTMDDLVLTQMDWLQVQGFKGQLLDQPWFLQNDGALLIVRDKSSVPKDMIEFQDLMRAARDQKKAILLKDLKDKEPKRQIIKEKALKITVIKKESQVESEQKYESQVESEHKQESQVKSEYKQE